MSILFLFLFFAASIVSAENIVTVIVGGLSTFGVTHFIKTWTGLRGFGATILAVIVAVAVAIVAVAVQMAYSGDFSQEAIAGYAVTIFSLATLAYNAMKSTDK